MRGSAAQGETPQCTVDIDFVHEEHSTELWAATVVQHAWGGWRERMAMLLLLYGFATLDGDPESLCAPLLPRSWPLPHGPQLCMVPAVGVTASG